MVHLGIHAELPPWEARAIGLTNRICVFCILIFLLSVGLNLNYWPGIMLNLLSCALFSMTLYFNYLRKYNLAKHALMLMGNLVVIFVNMVIGKDFNPIVNYATAVLIPPLIFHRFRTIMFYICLSVIGFFLIVYYQTHFPPLYPDTTAPPHLVSYINTFMVVFVFLFGVIYFYRGTHKDYENVLIQKNEALARQGEEIMAQNESLSQQAQAIRHINSRLQETLTDLRQVQETLIHTEKMASLGQLTAGIAHEINNPINFVSANIPPLKKDFEELSQYTNQLFALIPTDSPLKSKAGALKQATDPDFLIEEIEALLNGVAIGAKRTQEIVAGLRLFSRSDDGEAQTGNIHESLDTSLLLLHNLYKNRITVVKDYAPNLPQAVVQPGKISQVFINILSNAAHAIEGQGTVRIRTGLFTHETEGDFIEISIQDSGPGIPETVVHKIFDPFFTTKDVGKGTGLGLAISYGIIKQHKGTLTVSSKEGEGATFIIRLPVTNTDTKG